MEERLSAQQIKTCADLQDYSLDYLVNQFGVMGQRLFELAQCIDNRPVNPERIRKSISVEETYLNDLPHLEACLAALPELITRLEVRMSRAGESLDMHTLFIKLKFNDFQQTTVERIHNKVDSYILNQLIQEGFSRKCRPVRLIGVGIKLKHPEKLHQSVQLSLFNGTSSFSPYASE